jgi:FlaA1/EpsC-like NDP-sugar epimerase
MRSANSARRVEVVERLSRLGLRVRILPAFVDIADGKHTVDLIRDVEIGDLLGRDAVPPDPASWRPIPATRSCWSPGPAARSDRNFAGS